MDEVIFEEFKGPATWKSISTAAGGPRFSPPSTSSAPHPQEELLYHPDECSRVVMLRRALTGVPPVEQWNCAKTAQEDTEQHHVPAVGGVS